jgi:hypothetical protein
MAANITIPRFAPVTNMALTLQPDLDPQTEQWRGQYVAIPSTPAIDFDVADDFTVEVWVSLPEDQVYRATRDNAIVEKWAYPTDSPSPHPYPYVIRCYNSHAESQYVPGVIYAARYDGNRFPVIRSEDPINDGQFHHVAFVKDGSQLWLYVDAQQHDPVDDTVEDSTQNDLPLCLGRRLGGQPTYLTGSVGQLRIWGRALSPAEVTAHFVQGPLAGPADGALPAAHKLAGDWRCNEGYGTVAYDYALGNHGSLGGGDPAASPTWTVSTIRLAPLFNLTPGLSTTLPILRSAVPPQAPEEEAEQTAARQTAGRQMAGQRKATSPKAARKATRKDAALEAPTTQEAEPARPRRRRTTAEGGRR